ncbi:MAG: hypothetical protein K5829_14735 [Treponema sp.]|nr:hypothetical protein [Treponema sp.]
MKIKIVPTLIILGIALLSAFCFMEIKSYRVEKLEKTVSENSVEQNDDSFDKISITTNEHGEINNNEKWIIFGLASFMLFITLEMGFGVESLCDSRLVVSLKVLSIMFLIIHIVINLIVSLAKFNLAGYVIPSGVMFLLNFAIVYAIYNSHKNTKKD